MFACGLNDRGQLGLGQQSALERLALGVGTEARVDFTHTFREVKALSGIGTKTLAAGAKYSLAVTAAEQVGGFSGLKLGPATLFHFFCIAFMRVLVLILLRSFMHRVVPLLLASRGSSLIVGLHNLDCWINNLITHYTK